MGAGSSYDLTTEVPVADIGRVAVGQRAAGHPGSTNSVVTGHVSSVGVLATTGTSTTTYPVTVSFDAADLGHLSGADADVAIVTKRSVGVMTVPSSAVRTVGTIHLVTVLKNGTTPTPVRVTLGTVGDVLTQVTVGTDQGRVRLVGHARRAAPQHLHRHQPGRAGRARRGPAFGGGGFGGAGFGGGGFGGREAGRPTGASSVRPVIDDALLHQAVHETGVRRLQHAYADVVNRRAWPELEHLFLSDADVVLDLRAGDPLRLTGGQALGEFIGNARSTSSSSSSS